MRNGQLFLRKTAKGFEGHGQIITLDLAIGFLVRHHDAREGDDSAPAFRLASKAPNGAEVEIGAAWAKQGERGNIAGKTFFSITADDPSFDAPLNVTAFPTGEDKESFQIFDIVWSRPKQKVAA